MLFVGKGVDVVFSVYVKVKVVGVINGWICRICWIGYVSYGKVWNIRYFKLGFSLFR